MEMKLCVEGSITREALVASLQSLAASIRDDGDPTEEIAPIFSIQTPEALVRLVTGAGAIAGSNFTGSDACTVIKPEDADCDYFAPEQIESAIGAVRSRITERMVQAGYEAIESMVSFEAALSAAFDHAGHISMAQAIERWTSRPWGTRESFLARAAEEFDTFDDFHSDVMLMMVDGTSEA